MKKFGFLANGEMLFWDGAKLAAFIRGAGYDAVELIDDIIFSPDRPQGYIKDLLKACDDNGIFVSEVLVQHDLVLADPAARKAQRELIIANIAKAADMGVKTVNLFTGPVPWDPSALRVGASVSYGDAWNMVFEAFDEIIPAAENYGVKLAVENVWGMLAHDFYTNSFLQSRYGSKSLGVNLDVSHDTLYGINDPAFIIRQFGKDKIFHVHLKDAVGIPEDGKFVFPLLGEGNVNFKALFAALDEIGYDGVVSVEFESWRHRSIMWGGEHAKAAPAMREAIDKLLAL
ncbi:MAG: sugar phosphate isomerase/epimerase [Clostridia bacterium]|nr:sugar phosphate isomerase/epimerase [Clostridia bacterium]